MKYDFGLVGLGVMGRNFILNVAENGFSSIGLSSSEEKIKLLKQFAFLIRKVLSKKIRIKFLPKILFAKDESFEYAEKIENLIKQTNK